MSISITRLALLTMLVVPATYASELVYTPVNPSFGGNPLNSGHLIFHASSIKDDEPSSSAFDRQQSRESPLQRLASSLESRLISQLLADVGNGNTGQLETDDFYLNIVDDSGTLLVQIVDKTTGESTEINVSGLTPDL